MFQWVLCGPIAACATLSHKFCYFTSLLCGRTHRHILFGLILASFLKVHTSSRSLKGSGSLCLQEEDGLQHLDLLSFWVLTQRSRQLRAGNHPYTSMSLPVLLRPVPLSLSVTVSHNLESITFWVHPHQKNLSHLILHRAATSLSRRRSNIWSVARTSCTVSLKPPVVTQLTKIYLHFIGRFNIFNRHTYIYTCTLEIPKYKSAHVVALLIFKFFCQPLRNIFRVEGCVFANNAFTQCKSIIRSTVTE